MVTAVADLGVELGGSLFEVLGLGSCPLGFGDPVLGVAFAVGSAQFGFGAFSAGPSDLLIGCGLRGLSLRRPLFGLPQVFLGLFLLAFGAAPPEPGEDNDGENGEGDNHDDNNDNQGFHERSFVD